MITELYNQYRVPLIGFLRKKGVSTPDAEDTVANVFMKLFEHPEKYQPRPGELPFTFLCSCVTNRWIDYTRRLCYRHEFNHAQIEWVDECYLSWVPRKVHNKELVSLVMGCIPKALTKTEQFIFNSICLQGFSYQAIASETGKTRGDIANRYYVAKCKIQKYILLNYPESAKHIKVLLKRNSAAKYQKIMEDNDELRRSGCPAGSSPTSPTPA